MTTRGGRDERAVRSGRLGGSHLRPDINAIGDARKFVDYGSTSSVRYVHVATLRGPRGRSTACQVGYEARPVVEGVLVQRETHCGAVRRRFTLRIIALCDIGFKESDPLWSF